ncbi:Detected protein of confused Function [Hibiscus syriacus]|uniref:Detected protein of confused Function n=1 Tax=Hibiscus syriacus TaxID=106335 RepID=A0A6A2WK45_HIBSY|nr:Detected protein of confused Function [Hibiscus syriacus]
MLLTRQTKLQGHSEAETSIEAEKMEDQSQNLGPMFLPQLMINWQMARQVPIPRYSDSSNLLLEINQEQIQGSNLGITFPINSVTPYGAQKGKLPITSPHDAGLIKSMDPAPLNGWPFDMTIQTAQMEHQNHYNLLQQLQDNIKAEEYKPVDDTVDSFLSHDDDVVDNPSTPFKILRHRSSWLNKTNSSRSTMKAFSGVLLHQTWCRLCFTFEEVSCLHSSKSKVLSCHFSSDGKFLGSAEDKKKVLIWNLETLDFVRTSEGHSLLITDPRKSLFKLVGHAEQVLSLDFHPRKVDLLCSCDSNNEMRLWNINQRTCINVSKPGLGKLIATASGNVVNVIDVETNKPQFCLKGHDKDVLSICWDPCGKYIASISEDSARVWSVSGGEWLHDLFSTGNKFQSCTFHPTYSQLLVIGGYQIISQNKKLMTTRVKSRDKYRAEDCPLSGEVNRSIGILA